MSDLTETRDHALRMAADTSTTDRDAELWLQLAGEIDRYLTGDTDEAPEATYADVPFDWAADPSR